MREPTVSVQNGLPKKNLVKKYTRKFIKRDKNF